MIDALVEQLSGVGNVVAVTLGGSRAVGAEREDSDWDVGLYYRGTLDTDQIRALGHTGQVFEPGEWAEPMHGGAWLTIDDTKVDVIYRDLDRVEAEIARAAEGSFEIHRVPGYVAGMPSYTLLGEIALGKVLHGELPDVSFPDALHERAPQRWRHEAGFSLMFASGFAARGDAIGCGGNLAVATMQAAHAVFCERGEWTLNEKRLVRRAGLGRANEIIAVLGTGPRALAQAVSSVAQVLGVRVVRDPRDL